MKRLPSYKLKSLHGFTLVELLVVIGIIAILASVLITVAGTAINSAKRVKAFNTATGLQTAVTAYYTEYSVYPAPSGTTTDYVIKDTAAGTDTGGVGDPAAWKILLCALSGNISPLDGSTVAATTIPNTRGISFISLKRDDVYDSTATANVALMNPLPTGTSKYFNVAIDSDYSGVIGTSGTGNVPLPSYNGTYATSGGTTTSGAAVWANCNASTTKTNLNWYVHTY